MCFVCEDAMVATSLCARAVEGRKNKHVCLVSWRGSVGVIVLPSVCARVAEAGWLVF